MRRLRGFFVGLTWGALLLVGNGVSANPLTDELAYILANHPRILAAGKTSESTAREVDNALAGFLPTVALAIDHGPEYIDNPARRDTGTGNPWLRNKTTASLTVTQNLFNGFATSSAVRTARLNKEIAGITYEGTRQNVLLEGIGAYIDVLRQKRLVELATANEHTIQTQLNLEDERVQRGSGIAVDVLQAKSRLQIAKERRVNFEGGLIDAISRYTQTFNHPPEIDEMMDPIPPVDMIPTDLEEAIHIALRENPAITNSDVTIEMARERETTIMSEYYPTFDLVGSMNYEKHSGGTLGTRRDMSLIVQGNWNLFTGFSTETQLSQTAFILGASKDNFTDISRKIVEQAKLSWQALLTVRERLQLLENAVNIAAEVFQSRKKLREAGKETVINVLDAEGEVMNAQINFAAASYDQRLAIYQLVLAMGRLNGSYLRLASR